jgi:toxin ParE1/3/4
MPRVFRTSQAECDLIDILAYVGERNPAAAGRLATAIDEKCHILAQFPLMGRERSELAPGLRSFPVNNYIIFYQPIDDGIQVIRVLHGARDFPALFGG